MDAGLYIFRGKAGITQWTLKKEIDGREVEFDPDSLTPRERRETTEADRILVRAAIADRNPEEALRIRDGLLRLGKYQIADKLKAGGGFDAFSGEIPLSSIAGTGKRSRPHHDSLDYRVKDAEGKSVPAGDLEESDQPEPHEVAEDAEEATRAAECVNNLRGILAARRAKGRGGKAGAVVREFFEPLMRETVSPAELEKMTGVPARRISNALHKEKVALRAAEEQVMGSRKIS